MPKYCMIVAESNNLCAFVSRPDDLLLLCQVKYNCKQGDCATCVINIDGRNVKACQGKVPASRRIVKIKA